ncbi:hypothetical protein FCM35_KLT08176 [Carex littledalei]|uniref:Secreted protein n=1 Tax=Carex littledalei TaxID=544730 RepID=A0A833V6E9_9POAL|nr:hypothetical protein FCM35_KLT08176 [Carex littledalei]
MKWGGSSWLVMHSASLLQISTLTSTAIHYSCARIFTSEDRNNIYFEIFFKSNRHGFIEKTLVRCPRFAFYLKAWVLPVVDHILSMRLILKKILRLRKLIVGFCKKQRLSNIFIDSCFLVLANQGNQQFLSR